MSTDHSRPRRELIAALAGLGTALAGSAALGETSGADAPPGHAHHAVPPPSLTDEHRTVITSTAECQRAGRACLARCTDHLASGMADMAACQRAVMNMLSVTGAMADVAGYANSAPADMQSLAAVCARYCEACAQACEPHAVHHEECRACREACLSCARACRDLAA